MNWLLFYNFFHDLTNPNQGPVLMEAFSSEDDARGHAMALDIRYYWIVPTPSPFVMRGEPVPKERQIKITVRP